MTPETTPGTAKPFRAPIGALNNGFAQVQRDKFSKSETIRNHNETGPKPPETISHGFGLFGFGFLLVSDGFAHAKSNKISGFSEVSVFAEQIKTSKKSPFYAGF